MYFIFISNVRNNYGWMLEQTALADRPHHRWSHCDVTCHLTVSSVLSALSVNSRSCLPLTSTGRRKRTRTGYVFQQLSCTSSATPFVIPTPVVVNALWVEWSTTSVILSVGLWVWALKENDLSYQYQTWYTYFMAGPWHALTLRSKGQGHRVIPAWVCLSIWLLRFLVRLLCISVCVLYEVFLRVNSQQYCYWNEMTALKWLHSVVCCSHCALFACPMHTVDECIQSCEGF